MKSSTVLAPRVRFVKKQEELRREYPSDEGRIRFSGTERYGEAR